MGEKMEPEFRAFLENAEPFAGLYDEQLNAIASSARVVWFDSGQPIIQAEETGDSAFLVLSGTVTVADGGAPEGYQKPLGPGTLIGEMAMLTEVAYAATVVAAEHSRALAISRDALYQVMESDPEIAEHFSAKLLGRLSSIAEDLREVDDRFEALNVSLERAGEAA